MTLIQEIKGLAKLAIDRVMRCDLCSKAERIVALNDLRDDIADMIEEMQGEAEEAPAEPVRKRTLYITLTPTSHIDDPAEWVNVPSDWWNGWTDGLDEKKWLSIEELIASAPPRESFFRSSIARLMKRSHRKAEQPKNGSTFTDC